ncbi:MAG: PadR family transcriptional regulator [bacterium]|nr:MAG: PadR family transcriptional regulator [bacterium]
MLGHLEENVLLAVLELEKTDEGAFGLSVFYKLKVNGIGVVNGSVYNTLDRLENKGLLRSQMTEPIAERGGRRKRIYFLEEKGLKMLQDSYSQKRSAIFNLETALNNV